MRTANTMTERKRWNMPDKKKAPAPPMEEQPQLIVPPEPYKPSWPTGMIVSKSEKPSCYLPDDLQVILSQEAFEQLFGYAYATANEISCLGVVKRQGNCFIVERFHLVAQEGGLARTEMNPQALAELMTALLQQGKKEEARSLKCWAHSHPNMGVYCPTIIGGLIALQVKAHALGQVPAREILFDLPTLKLMPSAVDNAA